MAFLNRNHTAIVALASLLLAACGGATPTPTPLPNGQATVVVQGNPSQADWLALTERLADDRSPVVNNTQLIPGPPVVTIGGLPASIPFVLPLPDRAIILGSIVRPNSLRGEDLILLDVPQPAASINAFYQSALAQQGFTPWLPGNPQSFQPANSALLFCQRDKGIQLELDVYGSPGQISDVRLSYSTNPRLVSCNQDVPQGTTLAGAMLPTLTLPDGVVSVGTSNGEGYDGWAYSQREISTPAAPADLDALLRPQLVSAGWVLAAESHTGPVAWSKWTFRGIKGDYWSGILVITAGQGSLNSRLLLFQLEQVS